MHGLRTIRALNEEASNLHKEVASFLRRGIAGIPQRKKVKITLKLSDLPEMLGRRQWGDLTAEECLELFQFLLDTGLAWELELHYRQLVHNFVEAGYINVFPGKRRDHSEGNDNGGAACHDG
jgi:hypothetical protein